MPRFDAYNENDLRVLARVIHTYDCVASFKFFQQCEVSVAKLQRMGALRLAKLDHSDAFVDDYIVTRLGHINCAPQLRELLGHGPADYTV